MERIKESDLVLPILRLLSESPSGFITTTDLTSALAEIFNPMGKDAQIIDGRNDTYFSQKVRNIISHRKQETNMIAGGFAEYKDNGLQITVEGKALLINFTKLNT